MSGTKCTSVCKCWGLSTWGSGIHRAPLNQPHSKCNGRAFLWVLPTVLRKCRACLDTPTFLLASCWSLSAPQGCSWALWVSCLQPKKRHKAYCSREQHASTSCRTHLHENHRALKIVSTYMDEKRWNPHQVGCVQHDAALQCCQSHCLEMQCMRGSCPACALSNSGTSNWLHEARVISLCA